MRWDPYVLVDDDKFDAFWRTRLTEKARRVLFVLGRGFDRRATKALRRFIEFGVVPRVWLLAFDNGQEESTVREELTEANYCALVGLVGAANVVEMSVRIGGESSIATSRSTTEAIRGQGGLGSVDDVVIDISAMPRVVALSAITQVLHDLDSQDSETNLHVVAAESVRTDLEARGSLMDEVTSLDGFSGRLDEQTTEEVPRVWFPVLGEAQGRRLELIHERLNPDEICPVVPFPSRDPRRGDEIVSEHGQLLFTDFRIEPSNILRASEFNPFEAYRQLFWAMERYRRALGELGGCKAFVSPLSSKLLSVGALLACYDHRFGVVEGERLRVGIPYVETGGVCGPGDRSHRRERALFDVDSRGVGAVTRVLKRLALERGSSCWGAGFVAMDVVDDDGDRFAAVGGSCGNVMAILAWLGWAASPIVRLGDDPTGAFIRNELSGLGVDLAYVSREQGMRSPIVLQRFGTGRDGRRTHRFSLTCPGCGRWLPRHRPITLAHWRSLACQDEGPDAFYFDRVSPASLRLATEARRRGALVVFEPSSVEDEAKFQAAVDASHVLKYSDQRLGHVPDLGFTASPALVVETRAASGLRYRWEGRWTRLEAFAVKDVVDAAGSGDWCSAAIIHRLGQRGATGLLGARRKMIDGTLQVGQAAAAVNCGFRGARGAMQALTLKELNRRLTTLEREVVATCEFDRETPNLVGPSLQYCEECDVEVRRCCLGPKGRVRDSRSSADWLDFLPKMRVSQNPWRAMRSTCGAGERFRSRGECATAGRGAAAACGCE